MARQERERFGYDTSRTVDDIRRQQRSQYDSFVRSDIPQLKVKEGDNTLRIMPRTWTDTERWDIYWSITIWLHYGVGPDDASYLCLDKMKGERCPICEARHSADPEEADDMRPVASPICWVIDRDNEKAGPQVWRMPKKQMFDELNTRSIDKKTNEPIFIDHVDEGYDFVFTRTGKDKRTKYTGVEVLREATPLHENEKIQDRWMDYITENPLPSVLQYYDAEYIEKVLYGAAGGEERSSRRAHTRGGGDRDSRRERPRTTDDDDARGGRRERYRPVGDNVEDTPRASLRERFREDDEGGRDEVRTSRRRDDDRSDDRDDRDERGRRDERRSRDLDEPERRAGRRDEARRGRDDTEVAGRRGNGAHSEEDDFQEETTTRRGRGRDRDDDERSPSQQARGQLETMRSRR